ncbi:sigma-70 family RNA polymerase sigma factor [Bythopirellula polymerisocia]|nr:sigma-70 family RNA polymerase sigma factor [Bythopirellula polymerisocia]
MTDCSSTNPQLLLSQALAGERDCFGELLSVYRNYLKLLVVAQLERCLQQRVSPSDVVQETFLEANRDFDQFRGQSIGEFCAWLRMILVNNLHRVVEQHVLTAKRTVRREVSLEVLASSLEQSTARLDAILSDPGSSPSMNYQRQEQELDLANQIAALPPDYREVIVLRHIEALPFDEVARRMQRKTGATRMLWVRAIRCLREKMNE